MDLSYRLAFSDDREDDYLWRIQVYDRFSSKNECVALLVNRDRIREDMKTERFYQYMRRYSPGLGKLALTLFDRYGCLLEKFKTHAVNQGSEVFQEELDKGDILLIEQISASDDEYNDGIGSTLIDELLKLVHKHDPHSQHPPFVFALAATDDEPVQGTISFFRSVAFRRVGSSKYFCAALDLSHPCNALQAAEDFDPPIAPKASETVDQDGNTLAHIAAISGDLQTLKKMKEDGEYSELSKVRNNDNNTPLEALYEYLENHRSGRLTDPPISYQSDEFQGFEDLFVHTLAFLEDVDSPEALARLKGGCSCGRCIEGILSPRMSFAVEESSRNLSTFLDQTFDQFFSGNPGVLAVSLIPPGSIESQRKFCSGYLKVTETFGKMGATGTLPTEAAVLEEVEGNRDCRQYFRKGGSVQRVADAAMRDVFKHDDMVGDGKHQKECGEAIASLPKCRNDKEFRSVMIRCGFECDF